MRVKVYIFGERFISGASYLSLMLDARIACATSLDPVFSHEVGPYDSMVQLRLVNMGLFARES